MALRALAVRRILPRLRPRFWAEASRAGVFAHAFDEIVPAADLVLKYVTSHRHYTGEYAELYAFCNEEDVELLMDVWKDPEGKTHWEFGRMAGTTLDIYFDGELRKTFPRGIDMGYFGIVE